MSEVDSIHSCGYHCDKAACIKSQRDQLVIENESLRADAARIDWLESQCGLNLISDDGGRWAISDAGMQPVPPDEGFTEDVTIASIVFKDGWSSTIREAVDAAISKGKL